MIDAAAEFSLVATAELPRTMRAAVVRHYGGPDVVSVESWPTPRLRDDAVLVRVRTSTVTTADWRARSATMPPGFAILGRLVFGLTRPRNPILGTELAGDVIAVGARVTKFRVGDAVIAMTGMRLGAHAEVALLPEKSCVVPKPAGVSYAVAAALGFGGTTALDFLRRARLQSGESLLVNGATGGVGSMMVQLGKAQGAVVTAVCSAANADLARTLGADHVIDYATTDFADGAARYDVIADVAGTAPVARCRRALKPGGRVLLVLAPLKELLSLLWAKRLWGIEVIAGPAPEHVDDLATLADLAERGVVTPHIDAMLPLADIAEAHRRVDTGHKRGSVVVTMD